MLFSRYILGIGKFCLAPVTNRRKMKNTTTSNQSKETSANCFVWSQSSANCFVWSQESNSSEKIERPTVSLALEEITL